ncbi:MAG: hypothetical protein U1G07_20100 [Verrucomicrobiota bacterium]
MPSANRYFVPDKLYHLTHRCHNRRFLFKFAARTFAPVGENAWSLREEPVLTFGQNTYDQD